MRSVRGIVGVLTLMAALNATPAAAIEAVRGKTYSLSKQHGPWMVMVASFRNVPADRRKDGMSAEEAAAELVFELREKGIPAYTFGQDAVIEKIDTQDRLGRGDERIYAKQRDMICVLAGNYPSINDDTAQKTLKYIKSYRPKFAAKDADGKVKSGAIYRETPGRKGPLGGAFMTVNPLLSPDELATRKTDPLLLDLNSHSKHSLYANKAPYTLQVATFTGRNVTPIGSSIYAGHEDRFVEMLQKSKADSSKYNLNRAGEDAEQLANLLRSKGYEAYTYHDWYQSIVTVGGFATERDAAIPALVPQFCAKKKTDPLSKQDVIVAENIELDIPPNRNNPAGSKQTFMFDPQPQVIAVPRAK